MIALQTTGPADIDAIDKWIRKNASDDEREEFLASVAKLKTGEAYVWSPAWLEIFKRVAIRERRTFNSSATPKVGDLKREPTKLANVDLEKLTAAMSATIEKVKGEDPEYLKKEISELKKQLNAKPVPVAALPAAAPVEPKIKEIPALKDSQILRVEQAVKSIESLQEKAREKDQTHIESIIKYLDDYKANAGERFQNLQQQAKEIVEALNRVSSAKNMPVPTARPNYVTSSSTLPLPRLASPKSPADSAVDRSTDSTMNIVVNGEYRDKLNPKQHKMIDTLLTFEKLGRSSLQKALVATFADMKATGGSFNTYISMLKNGRPDEFPPLVTYEPGNALALTNEGRTAATSNLAIQSVTDLHDAWRKNIKTPKQRDMMDLVTQRHPQPVSKAELAAHIEMNPAGGSFNTYLSGMKALGIIVYTTVQRLDEYQNEITVPAVKATDLLFPEGLY